jgi:hypothetical protein
MLVSCQSGIVREREGKSRKANDMGKVAHVHVLQILLFV